MQEMRPSNVRDKTYYDLLLSSRSKEARIDLLVAGGYSLYDIKSDFQTMAEIASLHEEYQQYLKVAATNEATDADLQRNLDSLNLEADEAQSKAEAHLAKPKSDKDYLKRGIVLRNEAAAKRALVDYAVSAMESLRRSTESQKQRISGYNAFRSSHPELFKFVTGGRTLAERMSDQWQQKKAVRAAEQKAKQEEQDAAKSAAVAKLKAELVAA